MSSTENTGSTNYLLGRIETKVDRIDEKLDHQGETLAGHAERLVAVERDIRELKLARANDQQQRDGGLSAMKVALVSAVTSSLIGGGFAVIQIVTKN
ncbi:hypothetical protein AB0J55_17830 [Amycolatopsis sp. NPDC049688]|uniref:hypothetical protein n=1 Tax=Amycolatopsis sp. NPDC049688 TaxID=3154733 RepID=UPI0034441D63